MIAALLLMAAEPMTAIDAERAFAADAQKLGQWTAFRKYATDDAVMFVPQPTNAQAWLKDRKDPPVSVYWWPGRSYISCDGTVAVNTGPWVREWGKSVGYFTTVWKRQPDGGWKWLLDHGDALKQARGEGGDIKPQIASCMDRGAPIGLPIAGNAAPGREVADGGGQSEDGTLSWLWDVEDDGRREIRIYVWNGKFMEQIATDQVAAPPK